MESEERPKLMGYTKDLAGMGAKYYQTELV
jgi:hypothetical protein